MPLDVKKFREQQESRNERKNYIKLKPGENYIRFLPHTLKYFTEEVTEVAYSYYIHFNVGPEGAEQAVVCPKTKDIKARCPVCEAVAVMSKSEDLHEQAKAEKMGRRKRYLFNILCLDSEEEVKKGIQILECGPQIYHGFIQWINEKWGDPLDLTNGRNMTIHMIVPPSGNKFRTEYRVEPDPKTSSVVNYLPKDWKEQIKRLEEQVPPVLPYAEIKKILEGEIDEPVVEEEASNDVQQEVVSGDVQVGPSAKILNEASPSAGSGPTEKKKPDCFGVLFSARVGSKCENCPWRDECKVEFLGG